MSLGTLDIFEQQQKQKQYPRFSVEVLDEIDAINRRISERRKIDRQLAEDELERRILADRRKNNEFPA